MFSEGLSAVGVGVALYINSISLLTSVAAFSGFNLSVFLPVQAEEIFENFLENGNFIGQWGRREKGLQVPTGSSQNCYKFESTRC